MELIALSLMSMENLVELLHEANITVAVVGATDNPEKYGSVIYRDLKRKGFTVFPVNPKRSTVDGDLAFDRIEKISKPPTIVNLVVPPEVTLDVLTQCLNLGLVNIWLQTGSESPKVMRFLRENGFNYLANECIMVQSRLARR